MNKSELERELNGFTSSIETKKDQIAMLEREYSIASPVRKSQIMSEIKNLNTEITSLEVNRKNIENTIKNFPTESLDDIEKEKLSKMSVAEATEYFNSSSSRRDVILRNMSVEQIISVIKNVKNARLFINVIDDDKLLNVINNLDLDGIKKIFEKTSEDKTIDVFETGREKLINKLKGKGLTEDAIRNFKAIGYNDFDNEIIHANSKNDNSRNNLNYDSNGLISIDVASKEINNIKKSYDDYFLSLGNINDLLLNDLNNIIDDNKFDNYIKRIDNIINSNIDKSDLNSYINLLTLLSNTKENINHDKNKVQLKIKSIKDEINQVNDEIKKVNVEIAKLTNEIKNITDPIKKAKKENELLKLKEELDDLIDKYNYLYQGDKYFELDAFKKKNKPIKYGSKAVKSSQSNQKPSNKPNQSQPNNQQSQINKPNQPQPNNQQNQTNKSNQSQQSQLTPSQIIPNSIKFYIDNGTLPDNLTNSEYINLANALSIPAKDMNYVLSDDELERLLTSKKVMIAFINKNVTKTHKKSINKYDDLIQKYEEILANMDSYKHSDKEKKFIEDTIKDLKAKRDKYNSRIERLGFENTNSYVNFESNKKNKTISNISKTMDNTEELLQKKYEELKDLQNEIAKNPKFKDTDFIDRKIQAINKEIKDLQSKQIYLNKTQTKIINKNTSKYISKVQEKQQRYRDEERLASAHANQMLRIEYEKMHLEDEQKKLNNNLISMTPSNKEEEKRKRKTERDLAKINRRLSSLKLKEGYCSLEHQICQGVALSGYTK